MIEAGVLAEYRLLGRSGLRVSPMALGTMTFGQDGGADAAVSRSIFDAYAAAGGNFIDTANVYGSGKSEELTGDFIAGQRDRFVLSTKYSLTTSTGDPNAGGNHRKSMMAGIEASLRRLKTDYIDLYYLHIWDATTAIEEVMRAFDDAVTQGKILYAGISDTPAWQVARMQTLADMRGWTPLVALQLEYNLINRDAERDLIPAANALGLGVLPWSPLAKGMLSGKYGRSLPGAHDSSRRARLEESGLITAGALAVAARVRDVAEAIESTSARVALAWLLSKSGVTAPIIGARTLAQFSDNLAAATLRIPADHLAALDEASAFDIGFPHDLLRSGFITHGLFGGTNVQRRS
jgi:aryl-alcohol dehydrogenase-like predicted oxidoreductase